MTDVTKFYTLEFDEQDRLTYVNILGNGDMPVIPIESQNAIDIANAKSALRAAGDFNKFGVYDHPLTQEGLHIYSKTGNLNHLFYSSNIGVVSVNFAGDGLPIPLPNPNQFPEGWAQVNVHNRRFTLSPFNPEFMELRVRKHDWIDAMVQGYGLHIRVLPFNTNQNGDLGYADTLISTWELPLEEARAQRIAGFQKADNKRYLEKPIQQARKKYGYTAPDMPVVEATTGEINASIMLECTNGKMVDVNNLRVPTIVTVSPTRGSKFDVKFDGTFYARARLAQVAAKKDWLVEVR